MDRSFKSCFMITFLISAAYVGLTLGHISDAVTQQNAWKSMLPNTPIPQALLDVLPKPVNEDGNKVYNGQVPLSQKVEELGYEPPSPRSLLKQDSATSVFILEKDLTPGVTLNIHFTKLSDVAYPTFPSPNLSSEVPPFSSKNLPQLFQHFSISPTSSAARIMNQTLARCEHPNPINGAAQFCATSLEKMATYVTQNLGNSHNIKAVSMNGVKTDALMPYKIMGVNQIAQDKSLIACHRLSFPYGVYYCHQPRGAATFSVRLVGVQDGARLNAYAMCHHYTAQWSPEYIAFKVLRMKPGDTVCHFFQPDNVIFYQG